MAVAFFIFEREEKTIMRKICMIESSDPREFQVANCIAVVMRVADGKHEFASLEEAVACIAKLQAKDPDLDYSVTPYEKLDHGYGGLKNDAGYRFFAGRLSKEAAANGCAVSDWVRRPTEQSPQK
jgi:hypothetical protein